MNSAAGDAGERHRRRRDRSRPRADGPVAMVVDAAYRRGVRAAVCRRRGRAAASHRGKPGIVSQSAMAAGDRAQSPARPSRRACRRSHRGLPAILERTAAAADDRGHVRLYRSGGSRAGRLDLCRAVARPHPQPAARAHRGARGRTGRAQPTLHGGRRSVRRFAGANGDARATDRRRRAFVQRRRRRSHHRAAARDLGRFRAAADAVRCRDDRGCGIFGLFAARQRAQSRVPIGRRACACRGCAIRRSTVRGNRE